MVMGSVPLLPGPHHPDNSGRLTPGAVQPETVISGGNSPPGETPTAYYPATPTG